MQNSRRVLRDFPGFVWHHRRWFLIWTAVALLFRAVFLIKFRLLTDDSYIYGEIAKNWLQTTAYGLTSTNGVESTYIRMPGYPGFLATIWAVVGVEHYTAVLVVQMVVDVATCWVISDMARRMVSDRAGKFALVLAALCPFFANYSAVALTEALAIFFAALALNWITAALDTPMAKSYWLAAGAATAGGILLRPDGGLLLAAIGIYLVFRMYRSGNRKQLLTGAILLGAVAIAPLLPWTIRNWIEFREFQPLTPVYATSPGEFVPEGFHKWVRTWIVDYVSVDQVWFNVDGAPINASNLPARAFDSPEQRAGTEELIASYNAQLAMEPVLDTAFGQLAQERIRGHKLRYYVLLPAARIADLWLRPRTEMLPLDTHWWRWEDDPHDSAWSIFLGVINLAYLLLAIVAAFPVRVHYRGLAILFILMRSLFLSWMPNPEPRYVLECYPAVLALAGAALATMFAGGRPVGDVTTSDLSHVPMPGN